MATGLKGQLRSWRTSPVCLQVLVQSSRKHPACLGQTEHPDLRLGWRSPSVFAVHVLRGQMSEGAAS